MKAGRVLIWIADRVLMWENFDFLSLLDWHGYNLFLGPFLLSLILLLSPVFGAGNAKQSPCTAPETLQRPRVPALILR